MEQTVYIDLYFIINFAMDFLCFFLTARLLSIKESLFRTLCASALGGIYACVSLLLGAHGIWSIVLDVLAALLISTVAFYKKGEMRRLFAYATVYAAVSILLGGAMTALFSFFNRIGLDKMLGSEEDADGISVWLFALLALLSGLAAIFGTRALKKKRGVKECRVAFCFEGRREEVRAIFDSGNFLREPISARPCIIVAPRVMRDILPEKLYLALRHGRSEKLTHANARRVRVLPMNTTTGMKMAYALRIDKVELILDDGTREVDAFVVMAEETIRAQGAEALVPAELDTVI